MQYKWWIWIVAVEQIWFLLNHFVTSTGKWEEINCGGKKQSGLGRGCLGISWGRGHLGSVLGAMDRAARVIEHGLVVWESVGESGGVCSPAARVQVLRHGSVVSEGRSPHCATAPQAVHYLGEKNYWQLSHSYSPQPASCADWKPVRPPWHHIIMHF